MWQVLDKEIEQEESMVGLSSEGHGEAVVPKDPNVRCTLHASVLVCSNQKNLPSEEKAQAFLLRADERGQSSRNSWEWTDAPVMEIKGSRVRVQVQDDLSQTPTSAPELQGKETLCP